MPAWVVRINSHQLCIVEIDESLFGKKMKYYKGTGKQDTWVFGLVEKGSRKAILRVVDQRNGTTLLPIIKQSQGVESTS